jgi:hypothetical protein
MDALNQVYASRPDLQALYNPDGSAKNPMDPRIAGIPSLQDWGNKYGVNESPQLKAAQSQSIVPTTPVSVDPSTQMPSSALATPGSLGTLEGALQTNSQLRAKILEAMMPSQAEVDLETQLNSLEALARNTQLSAQAGINQIEDKQIPMQFIVGQTASVMKQANLQLQTLSAQADTVLDRLGLIQKTKRTTLQVLSQMEAWARDDQQIKNEQAKLERAESEAAKEFAIKYGIQAPFYQLGDTIFNTATGKGYATPQEFFKAGGKQDWSNIQKVEIEEDPLEGAPVSYKEYQYAVKEGYKGSYNDYQTMDANRKAVRSSTTIVNQANKTEDRVRQIVTMNPNNWAAAAAQIDKEFGVGTATLYDSYLKNSYAPKRV